MFTKILLVVCAFGISNAAVIQHSSDDQDLIRPVDSVTMKLHAFSEISDVVDLLLILVQHLPQEKRDIARNYWFVLSELKSLIHPKELFYTPLYIRDELMSEKYLITSAENMFKKMLSHIMTELNNTSDKIVKRDVESTTLNDVEKTVNDIHDTTSQSEEKMSTLQKNLNRIEKGTKILHTVAHGDLVDDLFKHACALSGTRLQKNDELILKEALKKDKTLKEKLCTENTITKVKSVLQNGHKALKVLFTVLKKENRDKITNIMSHLKI